MDLESLRKHVSELVFRIGVGGSHTTMAASCEKLGLPTPDPMGSKRERMEACVAAIENHQLADVAHRLLAQFSLSASERNGLQDALWTNEGFPEITKRVRREVARAVPIEDLFSDGRRFLNLLDALWVLNDDPLVTFFGDDSNSLGAHIDRHVFRNRGDWSTEELFDALGAYEASDHRFALFLEGLASGDINPDEAHQRRFVSAVNAVLQKEGLELRETGIVDGYPTFELASAGNLHRGRPKNLIFASQEKPDLRLGDALDNDIEILSGADKVLVYDRPLRREGLRWRDLQDWWREKSGIDDEDEAKASLYRRLRESLPPSSPPQRTLFEAYHRGFGSAVHDLPALLPEVWLHWDPKTVKARGKQALLQSRMDFLLLLPHRVRVVIEVDGSQHYADQHGRADPQRYARMMVGDRDLRLSGYEVYRFGAAELMEPTAADSVKAFFVALFERHSVTR